MAQAVSRRLPTAEAQVRARVTYGICGGQSGTETGISPSFLVLPCSIIVPLGLHTHISSSGGRRIGPLVAAVRRHSLTPPTKNNTIEVEQNTHHTQTTNRFFPNYRVGLFHLPLHLIRFEQCQRSVVLTIMP
jgi:hypothetical protein